MKSKTSVVTLLHALTGVLGLAMIATFFASTVVVELRGDPAEITFVKRAIALSLTVLIPTMAAAGITGAKRAGASTVAPVVAKKRRMKWIAANGLLVLTPAALLLAWLASAGSFGTAFYAIQGVELVAGPVNVALMGLNVRDGLRLSGRQKRRGRAPDRTA